MVKIIFIRGAPAVGKTTVTKKLLKILKVEYKKDCAYFSEDDFRKQMQFKYKGKDLIAHTNSVEFIKIVILKLLEIDHYDYIFIEGQFRYKEVIEKYQEFISNNNFESLWFQFNLDLNEMKKRDIEYRNVKSKNIEDEKEDIDSNIPENAIIIDTKKPPEDTLKEVLAKLT